MDCLLSSSKAEKTIVLKGIVFKMQKFKLSGLLHYADNSIASVVVFPCIRHLVTTDAEDMRSKIVEKVILRLVCYTYSIQANMVSD